MRWLFLIPLTAGLLLDATRVTADSDREAAGPSETARIVKLLGRNAIWKPVERLRLPWPTFHTQGLVKAGDVFFVSAVEVLEPRLANGTSTDALYDFSIDRSAGAGRGWLFAFDRAGHRLGELELGQGDMYHPGGIDFDGRYLWVPVAEYRPNSHSNIYRVDPATLRAELVFSEADHIGGIVRNGHGDTLHGVSWGSRRLYTWALERATRTREAREPPLRVKPGRWQPNPQAYIDYQDCHYQGIGYMLCGGVASYSTPLGSISFGGLDLVDLRTGRMEHQLPVNVYVDGYASPNASLALTHNAFWAEPTGEGSLRLYFITDSDTEADLLVYDVTPWTAR